MSQLKSEKKQKWIKKRHNFWRALLAIPVRIYLHLGFGYKYKKLEFDRKKKYFILCNHQTDLDAIMVYASMKRVVYVMATDSLFSTKYLSKWLHHAFAPIPKRKGVADQKSVKTVLQVAREGGDILIFPEGNRSYAEFQYPIDMSIIKLVKKCKLPLMLLNINGGTGVSPRFAKKKRKGNTIVSVRKIIPYEELNQMSNEDLLSLVQENLRVYDSESGKKYASKERAEYLERMLFVCPKCNSTQTLVSQGAYVSCSCGLKVEYTEDLKLKSETEGFDFTRMNDWYQFQKKWVREKEFSENETIFEDNDVSLYISHIYEKRKLVMTGKLILTTKELIFGDSIRIPLTELFMASPISGRKFNFSTKDESYLVIGSDRFNPLKYILLFNRLDTPMRGNDLYYSIEE